jgi:hypothetical protein
MATFRRNGAGEWVVFGTPDEVKPGKVRVERKDRTVRFVDVVGVGRPFSANGRTMVYGYLTARADEAPAPKPAPAPVAEPVESASPFDSSFDF